MFRHLLEQASLAKNLEGSWLWALGDSACWAGIRGTSRFWQGVWDGWKLVRFLVYLKEPTNREEALTQLPIRGVAVVFGKMMLRLYLTRLL